MRTFRGGYGGQLTVSSHTPEGGTSQLYHALQGSMQKHSGMCDKPSPRVYQTFPRVFCIDPYKAWYNIYIMRASSLHSLDTASVQECGGHVGVVHIIASCFNNGQQRYTTVR